MFAELRLYTDHVRVILISLVGPSPHNTILFFKLD